MIRKRALSCNDMHPQFKCHVGEKEVNLGVNRDENMQTIYAKTLEKLFKGSQKKETFDTCSTSPRCPEVPECIQYKQMFLDNKCQLQTRGCMKQQVNQTLCGACNRRSLVDRDCNFCEKVLCDCCSSSCKRCGKCFCSMCIFVLYEGNEEFSVCRWCY
ncbi:hypothetical protein J437_LFUL008782 [Ladona fulva]|uniref:Apoptosis regulatory protein Siva n=1 Tax=Ladona fulva TaxID=123851 RepID=A0A8K0NUN0_LADFU|nr:hypothetical protein J437_LFUL008782 [Ladona fulva]